MNLFYKMFYVRLSIILSCLSMGIHTQDQGTDSTAVNTTAKDELMGRSMLSTWPTHRHDLHLLPSKHGIGVGAGPFGARARHASTNSPISENQQTPVPTMPSWLFVHNQEQPIELEDDLIAPDNESIKRFARQNPGLLQDLFAQFQRTNEQLAQHWAPTLDTLQQHAPILYQMPLLGQVLGQSILGSADSIVELFTRSANEEEKAEIRTTPTIIQQDQDEKRKHLETENSSSLLQALFGSKLFQELQRLTENPPQLTQPFHLNPLFGRNNKNYVEAAPSDISEVKVQPNNIIKRTLAYKKGDKNLKDLKKIIPHWFNLPKSSTKQIKSFANDNEIHTSANDDDVQKKLATLERQLITELKQLQFIVKLAHEMKLQTGHNDGSLVLHKIPVQKITIVDIENAIKNPDVMNILKSLREYHQTIPHKRETSVNTNYNNNMSNMLDYAAPLHNYYIPKDESVQNNNNQPMSTGELENHMTESNYIRDRGQPPILQCHVSNTNTPQTSNIITQTANLNPHNSMNNDEQKIYYSSIKLPWFNGALRSTNHQNNLKNYPSYPLYRAEQSDTKMSITDLLNSNEFKTWLLSEARHIIGSMGLPNTTSSPTQSNVRSTESVKEETIRSTTPNILSQLPSESSGIQMDKMIFSLNKTDTDNKMKINGVNIPNEMRLATPQMPQSADIKKGNLFGILPPMFTQNIMAQHTLERQEYPKNSNESLLMEPKLRTFHTPPPTVINYYYNMPNKDISSQVLQPDNLLKAQQNDNPTNNYAMSYQLNPLITNQNSELYMDTNNAFKQNHELGTSFHGLNFYSLVNNQLPLKVAVGDDQILEMLRQQQTLPVTFL